MQRPLLWFRLQAQMTISYVLVTVVAVLILELLVFSLLAFSVFRNGNGLTPKVQQTAQQYAHLISQQVKGATLASYPSSSLGDPGLQATPGETVTGTDHIVVPHINKLYSAEKSFTFALLIAPNEQIFASSYPRRYIVGTSVSQLLSNRASLIEDARQGNDQALAELVPIVYQELRRLDDPMLGQRPARRRWSSSRENAPR